MLPSAAVFVFLGSACGCLRPCCRCFWARGRGCTRLTGRCLCVVAVGMSTALLPLRCAPGVVGKPLERDGVRLVSKPPPVRRWSQCRSLSADGRTVVRSSACLSMTEVELPNSRRGCSRSAPWVRGGRRPLRASGRVPLSQSDYSFSSWSLWPLIGAFQRVGCHGAEETARSSQVTWLGSFAVHDSVGVPAIRTSPPLLPCDNCRLCAVGLPGEGAAISKWRGPRRLVSGAG